MTMEAVKHVAEVHPELLYIQITAWATVALMLATIGMIVWQIRSMRSTARIQLSMQLMDQYDSISTRADMHGLATLLRIGVFLERRRWGRS